MSAIKASSQVIYYLSSTGGNPVLDFLNSLEVIQRAKVFRIFQAVEAYGLDAMVRHVKKLTGTPLWEIRILGKDNIRLLYITATKERIVILHGFIKKKQKTPEKDLAIALKRYKEWSTVAT